MKLWGKLCVVEKYVYEIMSFTSSKKSIVYIPVHDYFGVRMLKRFLVVQNLKIAESSVFIFSKLFDLGQILCCNIVSALLTANIIDFQNLKNSDLEDKGEFQIALPNEISVTHGLRNQLP